MPYIGQAPTKGDENNFKILDDISSYTLTFDGSDSSLVSAANDTITLNNHRFITGQRVTYNNGGGGNINGLTSGSVYFIIKQDHNTIKLATSASNAISGTAEDLSLTGTSGSSHTLNVAFDGVNTKFKATHTNGTKAKITRSAQLVISLNGVIQQPHDSTSPSTGFGFDLDGVIIFSQAPVSTDIFWAHVLTNNNVTFDISDNTVDTFSGNGSTTTFNLSKSPANNDNILVTIDGVVQYPDDASNTRAYSVVENVLTFTSAPADGTEIQVRHIGFAGSTSAPMTGFYGRTGNAVLKSTDNITVNDAAVTGNLTVDGNFIANGDFTTLNTTLREVELLRVDAQNDNVAAGIITQRGSGDILNLYDGSTEVFSVEDGGKVKIGMGALGTDTSDYDAAANNLIVGTGSGDEGITILSGQSVGHHGSIFFADGTGATNSKRGQIRYEQNNERMKFFTAGTQKLTIDINGNVGIGSTIPSEKLDVVGDLTITGTGSINNDSSTDFGLAIRNNSTSAFSTSEHIEGTTNRKLTPLMIRNAGATANTETYLGFDAGNTSKAQWNIGIKKTASLSGDFIFNTRTGSSTSDERLRITSAGRVGITTNDPQARLDVRDTSALGILSRSASTQATDTNKALKVRNNSTTDTFNVSYKGQGYFAGKVGIGTDNPGRLLTLFGNDQPVFQITNNTSGTASTRGSIFYQMSGTTTLAIDNQGDGTGGIIQFMEAGRNTLGIATDGDVTITGYDNSELKLRCGTSSGNSIIAFLNSGGVTKGNITYDSDHNFLLFNVNEDERLRITSTGQVSISGAGTTFGVAKLNIAPANRTTAFDASDGDTWHDVVIKQSASATTNSVGIAFEISPSDYHKNAGTGICAIKDGNNFDYGTHLAFITRPHTAVAEERLRITSAGYVGINTTVTATTQLQVQSDGDGTDAGDNIVARFQSFGSGKDATIQLSDNVAHSATISMLSSDLIFKQSGAETLRIKSDGTAFLHGGGATGANNTTTRLPNGYTFNIHGNSSQDGISIVRYNSGYGTYGLNIGRSKSSTVGTNVAVADNDELGHITFYGANGSGFSYAAQITAEVDGEVGTGGDSTDMPGALSFRTTKDGTASSTVPEKVRIDSDGRLIVGGGSDPAESTIVAKGNSTSDTSYSVLDMRRGEAATSDGDVLGYIRFSDTNIPNTNNNYGLIFAAVDGNSSDEGDNPGRLVFSTTADGASGPTERLRITSGGDTELRNIVSGINDSYSQYLKFRTTQTNGQSAVTGQIAGQGKSGWGGDLVFFTKPANSNPNDTLTERLRITSDGDLKFKNTQDVEISNTYENGSLTIGGNVGTSAYAVVKGATVVRTENYITTGSNAWLERFTVNQHGTVIQPTRHGDSVETKYGARYYVINGATPLDGDHDDATYTPLMRCGHSWNGILTLWMSFNGTEFQNGARQHIYHCQGVYGYPSNSLQTQHNQNALGTGLASLELAYQNSSPGGGLPNYYFKVRGTWTSGNNQPYVLWSWAGFNAEYPYAL